MPRRSCDWSNPPQRPNQTKSEGIHEDQNSSIPWVVMLERGKREGEESWTQFSSSVWEDVVNFGAANLSPTNLATQFPFGDSGTPVMIADPDSRKTPQGCPESSLSIRYNSSNMACILDDRLLELQGALRSGRKAEPPSDVEAVLNSRRRGLGDMRRQVVMVRA